MKPLTISVLRILASNGESIAYGRGLSSDGRSVLFIGDYLSMAELKLETDSAREQGIPAPTVSLEPWQILDDGRPGAISPEDM